VDELVNDKFGWAQVGGRGKYHYFPGRIRSLCGDVGNLWGKRIPGQGLNDRLKCAECKKRLELRGGELADIRAERRSA